jgi:hypothetical protein
MDFLRKLANKTKSVYIDAMILAFFDDPLSVETLLNNLSEADFNLDDVSVVTSDGETANAFAQNAGPLNGVKPERVHEALIEMGISEEGAKSCQDAVSNRSVLLAMNVAEEYRQAAEEIFQDHLAQLIKG